MLDKRKNCFNFIRLLAAVQVMVGHTLHHLNIEVNGVVGHILSFFPGVPIFFIMSGFLLWDSISRSNSFSTYAKKRIFRLYPELWGGVLLNCIIMIILYHDNIEPISFTLFQFTQSTIFQFWTPNSLRGYGCGTPNGSLWTIAVMVQCYVIIYFLYKILHNKKNINWIIVLTVFYLFNIIHPLTSNIMPTILHKLLGCSFIPNMWMFLIGAFINEKFDLLIENLKKYWFIFFGIFIIIILIGFDIGNYNTFANTLYAFAMIGFAYRFDKIKIKIDLSYGIYIYHMIFVNIFINFGILESLINLLYITLAATGCSLLSYFTLGKISKLKKSKLENKVATL